MCTMSRRPKPLWEGSVWCRGWRALMSAQLERVIATGITIPSPKDGDAAELLCGWRRQGVLQCVRHVSGAPTVLQLQAPCCHHDPGTAAGVVFQTRWPPLREYSIRVCGSRGISAGMVMVEDEEGFADNRRTLNHVSASGFQPRGNRLSEQPRSAYL
jgi:hypothetical protein